VSGDSFSNIRNLAHGEQSNAGDTVVNIGAAPAPQGVPEPGTAPPLAPKERSVFVVHGRDQQVRDSMFTALRGLGLAPWEWEQIVNDLGNPLPFVGEVIAHGMARAQAIVVLLTPDDVVALHPSLRDAHGDEEEGRPTGQARPNVLIELGMALMHDRRRTVIVEFGDLRRVGDLAGLNVVRFRHEDGRRTAFAKLVERLETAQLEVSRGNADGWPPDLFAGLDVYRRRPVS
jgi:predicted nucleotide-binding protein